MSTPTSTAEWFERERGIRWETLVAFDVRFPDQDTVVLPYSQGEKTRKFMPDGTRRFFFTQGLRPGLFNVDGAKRPVVFLVEGETDTMRLWQELEDEARADARGYSKPSPGVVGLSGTNTWRPELAAEFRDAEQVFVILDNDDYNNRVAVDQADNCWRQIRQDIGAKARRLRLPQGVKDLCEFFTAYDLDGLRALTVRPPVSVSRYRPLDLQSEPPPVQWLVEGLLAKGDVTLLVGDGGLGKSWWTMGLTLAVAQQHAQFLEGAVQAHGRVLYVDEENPEDVVFSRLQRLGLTPAGARQIRYLHNQGIRLDRKQDEFLEEAVDFNPTLIVLDSLTRLHTQDENSAGAVSALYNDGIKPLARETGAAVVLIHHTNKSGANSYQRSRGSSDIPYAVDAGIDFRWTEPPEQGVFEMNFFRSRRRKAGDKSIVRVVDEPDGSARLELNPKLDPPF